MCIRDRHNIDQQGLLTSDLKQDILTQTKLQRVEDLYRPYKQKKKTRATEAKRKGLEDLADWFSQSKLDSKIEDKARLFLNDEVTTIEDAIEGAKDIIAERISDNPQYRSKILKDVYNQGLIVSSKKKKAEDEKQTFSLSLIHISEPTRPY